MYGMLRILCDHVNFLVCVVSTATTAPQSRVGSWRSWDCVRTRMNEAKMRRHKRTSQANQAHTRDDVRFVCGLLAEKKVSADARRQHHHRARHRRRRRRCHRHLRTRAFVCELVRLVPSFASWRLRSQAAMVIVLIVITIGFAFEARPSGKQRNARVTPIGVWRVAFARDGARHCA